MESKEKITIELLEMKMEMAKINYLLLEILYKGEVDSVYKENDFVFKDISKLLKITSSVLSEDLY